MKVFIGGASACIQEDLKLRLAAAGHEVWISASAGPVVRGLDVVDVLIFVDGDFGCLGTPPAQSFATTLLEMNPNVLILLSNECVGIRGATPELKSVNQRLIGNERIVAQWKSISGRPTWIVRAKFRPNDLQHVAEICKICEQIG